MGGQRTQCPLSAELKEIEMLLDELLSLCDPCDVDGMAPNDSLIGDTIDFKAARRLGEVQPIWLAFIVTEAFIGGTGVGFKLVGGTGVASDGDINAGETDVLQIRAVTAAASYTRGWRWSSSVPAATNGRNFRYYQIKTIGNSGGLTQGVLRAYMTYDPNIWRAVPNYEG